MNARRANKRNRRNALALSLAALFGAALFVLPVDRAQADDFGFSLNLGCFSLNIGSSGDRCDRCPPPAVAPAPYPGPRPIAAAPVPKPAPRPIAAAPAPKPGPRPIAAAPAPKPGPRPIAAAPAPKPGPTGAPAVVRGQAPNPRKPAGRATYTPVAAARAARR